MSEKERNELENESLTPDGTEIETPVRDARDNEGEEVVIDIEKTIESLSNRLTETTKKLEAAQKLAEDTKEAHIRTLAEYDNYRKRTAKEKTDSYNNGLTAAVMNILPVVDTLEMALSAPTTDENFKKGIEMTLTAAQNALKNLGVEEVEAEGKPFDPNLHNAVMQQQAEETEAGIVLKRLQKGYKIGDRVIRPATVIVSC